ncbi:alpha-L-rhamnosidase [Opitutus sp. ER46]|uniref:alpha-L-rhamnosidase n=1 Tax=Opitutus sp. ER46 TaxID=2161864 RepID=UPI000D317F85|nr:alpha-L-rhamnosidase [Opitutus sp. ER46]PTX94370.1 alpha-L-rhamnosidase [Opitutus sp. ER46]
MKTARGLLVTHLRCEYLVDPLGIDERTPRLSWELESDRRGARQVAYRVRVASTPEKLAAGQPDRWDSGRVETGQTTHVEYAGKPLGSRDTCHWSVEVWDETGATSTSATARWTMGLLDPREWTASWVAADPEIFRRDPQATIPTLTEPGTPVLFRKEFEITTPVRRATVYATARGVFELRLGGRRIGDDLFAPEWTDYDKRIHYRTYDVTELVRAGPNVLAATLGDGWWTGYVGWQETRARYDNLENSICVQLELELQDGGRVVVGTDASWRCDTGPILSSDFQMGETYDARRERVGWTFAGPLAAAMSESPWPWLPAKVVAPPAAVLVAQRSEPVRVIESFVPVAMHEQTPGVFIFDLGQNIAGFVQLRLANVTAGTRVTLRHGERLNPDGSLYTENLRRAKSTDVYVTRGGLEEVWTPHFTFHGFQYVEVTGLAAIGVNNLTGCAISSATAPVGQFECSNPEVNRLWLNGVWSQRDNFISVPTDCPQRDERLGWMGDAQVFLRTATCNQDVAAFFTKWMTDVEDAQTTDGIFPDVAPRPREDVRFVGLDGLGGGAGWADAGVIVPWTMWRVYGDHRIIQRHWRAMVAWLDWVERKNPRGIREHELGNNYGDWLCIPTDTSFRTQSPMKTFLATAYWADDAVKLARMARVIGREEDARRFDAMAARVRQAFQAEYVRADGQLTVETQTAYVLALTFDLLPPEMRRRAAERLVANIRDLGWHLSTGFIGVSHLNPTLTLAGHADVAYRLLLQDTFPSWLYPVKHGATTIWERWNGWTREDGFFNPQMNSFNHYSLGSIGEWLFRHVAGIELDPEVPGYERFVLRPYVNPVLAHARASYRTMHGEIVSEWKLDGWRLTWNVRIPANTLARVVFPSPPGAGVTENNAPLETSPGISDVRRDGDTLTCLAAGGSYAFETVVPAS